jgi:hypothetical protein
MKFICFAAALPSFVKGWLRMESQAFLTLANSVLAYTYQKLAHSETRARKDRQQDFSEAAIAFSSVAFSLAKS